MASVREEFCLSPYRKLLADLSFELSSREVETLNLIAVDFIPRGTTEQICTGLKFFDVLEQDGKIGPRNLSLLKDMFHTIGRVDLAWKVQAFLTTYDNNEAHGVGDDNLTDGIQSNVTEHSFTIPTNISSDVESDKALPRNQSTKAGLPTCSDREQFGIWDDLVTDGKGDSLPKSDLEDFQQSTRMDETDPRLVNMGELQDKTTAPQVGTSHLARQTLMRTEAGVPQAAFYASWDGGQGGTPQIAQCFATVCSDTSSAANNGTSSGWSGHSATVQTAVVQRGTQAHQGSSSGRIKPVGPDTVRYVNFLACEGYTVEIIGGKHFKTPEGEFVEMKSGTQYKIHVKNTHAYGCNLDISIDGYDVGGWVVDGGQEFTIERPAYEAKKFTFYRVKTAPEKAGIESGRPENGVVKCVFTPEAFLNIPVIISGSTEPLNFNVPPSDTVGDLKREVQRQLNACDDPDQVLCSDNNILLNSDDLRSLPPGNLKLIDSQLEMTIETPTKENFSVKVHPGRAKVHDVMEQIERMLGVPIRDQKLYYGQTRLSDAPMEGLPSALICSPHRPILVAVVPELIHVTIEDPTGTTNTVKIDKEKTLTDLLERIPSCIDLAGNEEIVFHFNGNDLNPFRDKGNLETLNICHGSTLKVDKRITFIEIHVCFQDATEMVIVRCSPDEIFSGLVKRMEGIRNKGRMKGARFAMDGKCFDPDHDKWPLIEYGVSHGSRLEMRWEETDDMQDEQLFDNNSSKEEPILMFDADTGNLKLVYAGGFGTPDRRICLDMNPTGSGGFMGGYPEDDPNRRAPIYNSMAIDDPDIRFSIPRFEIKSEMEIRAHGGRVTEPDPAWRAGGTTLQGYSTQQFMTAEPIKVDPTRKIELVLRLVARDDETDLVFPKDECKPLSTLLPPPVPE